MTKVTSKLLTLLLSFALVFTSIGWLGAGEVNAAGSDSTFKVTVQDQNGDPVDGVTLLLSDPEGVAQDLEFGPTENGVAVFDAASEGEDFLSEDNYGPGVYYLLKVKEEGYTYNETKVVFSGEEDSYVAESVNGVDYTDAGYVFNITSNATETVDYIAEQAKGTDGKWGTFGINYDAITADDFILDVRPDARWDDGHIAGSTHVNVAVIDGYVEDGSDLAKALDAAYEASGSKRIVIVCNGGQTLAARAMEYFNEKYFSRKGVDLNKITYLIGGKNSIPATDLVKTVDYIAEQAKGAEGKWGTFGINYDAITADDFILDVRPDGKWDEGHIAGSTHVNVAVISGYVEDGSDLAQALNAAYEASGSKRIVIVCNSGQTLAARTMQYFNEKYFKGDVVDLSKVTYLIGGANANIKAENTIPRTLGEEKERTMTTTIDMRGYEKGKVVKVWVPVPQTEDYQVISNEKFEAKTAKIAKFTTENVNGNKMLYLEWDANAEPASRVATLKFDAKRAQAGHDNLIGFTGTADVYPEAVQSFINKESTYVVFNDPIVQEYAEEAAGGKTNTIEKARSIYEWVINNLARIDNGEKIGDHVFEVEGCGYGDTVRILTDYKTYGIAGGHCTDLNSVFVALCRANGIPAREMFGIRLNDDATGGQHCWAEFYLPGTGWVFADPADVLKAIKPKKPADNQISIDAWNAARESDTCKERTEFFWGTVEKNRIVLSRGRDVTFEPAQSWGECNTFGYPAAEVDGARLKDFTDAGNFVYTITCSEVEEPTPTPTPTPTPSPEPAPTVKPEATVTNGQTAKVGGNTVKVISAKSLTAEFTKAANKKSVSVPATVKVNGKTLKVTKVAAKAFTGKKIRTVTIGKNVNKLSKNAFKGSKATKMILKTKKLKKASVKGSLKGSKVKTVQVKVGKKTVNKKYVKKYKKIFTKKNAGKKVKVK